MARTGRGWDAKPPAPSRRKSGTADGAPKRRQRPGAAADPAPGDPASGEAKRRQRPGDIADPASGEGTAERAAWDRADDGNADDGSADDGSLGQARRATDDGEPRSAKGGRWGRRGASSGKSGGQGGEGRTAWGRGRAGGRSARAEGESDEAAEPRDPFDVAREICLKQLAVRPHTRAELATALRKRGIDSEVATAILDRYSEVGMIDDAAFARAWVTSRHHGRGLAGRALAQELRRRGVEQEHVSEALSELDSDTEARTALELAMRKLRTTRGEPEAIFRKLLGMLARKGYSGGVAVRAVKEALATRDAELAELIDPDLYEE